MKRACYCNVYKNTCALLFKANNVKVLTTDINIATNTNSAISLQNNLLQQFYI